MGRQSGLEQSPGTGTNEGFVVRSKCVQEVGAPSARTAQGAQKAKLYTLVSSSRATETAQRKAIEWVCEAYESSA